MLDLKPTYLAMLQKILATYLPPNKLVWAYGSRITGQSHDGSDLDLVIIDENDPEIRLDNLGELREAISESDLPILVDIFDWASLPTSFREAIKQKYEEIKF